MQSLCISRFIFVCFYCDGIYPCEKNKTQGFVRKIACATVDRRWCVTLQ